MALNKVGGDFIRHLRHGRRRTAGLCATCVAAFGVAGLATTSSPAIAATPAAHSASGKITIALVTINETAAFFTEMNAGASAEAKKLGVSLVINNPDNSVSSQNTAVEDYADEHFQSIIVDSIDGPSVYPALKYAHKHGSHIVAVDSILHSSAVQSQVGVNNEAAGMALGNYFVTWAKHHLHGKAKIGVVGALNSPIQVQRQAGFVNAVKKAGSSIVQVVNGDNVEATAQTAAQNLVTAQPDMTAVYDTGEPANLGAISALKQAHKAGKVPLFGWDLDSTGIRAIKDGTEIAAVQQQPYEEGVQAVEAAVKLAKGKSAPKNITAPATIITKSNVGSVKPY